MWQMAIVGKQDRRQIARAVFQQNAFNVYEQSGHEANMTCKMCGQGNIHAGHLIISEQVDVASGEWPNARLRCVQAKHLLTEQVEDAWQHKTG